MAEAIVWDNATNRKHHDFTEIVRFEILEEGEIYVIDVKQFKLNLNAGLNLIHIPLEITEVNGMAQEFNSISDVYVALGGAATVNFLITYDLPIQKWVMYADERDKGGPTDKALTDDLGIIADMKTPVSVLLSGTPLGINQNSAITLQPGLNFIGIPRIDPRLTRVSDLLTPPRSQRIHLSDYRIRRGRVQKRGTRR